MFAWAPGSLAVPANGVAGLSDGNAKSAKRQPWQTPHSIQPPCTERDKFLLAIYHADYTMQTESAEVACVAPATEFTATSQHLAGKLHENINLKHSDTLRIAARSKESLRRWGCPYADHHVNKQPRQINLRHDMFTIKHKKNLSWGLALHLRLPLGLGISHD
jgi:hypothetical protein